ncbi:MAG: hypothetical protein JXB36_14635, partial [Gammaproteobacteria bacterium]|nr:hypothetical protein [Gammaproteobacteria bacterium]
MDLDGTLVDSAPDLNHCLGEALAAVDMPRPSEDQTRSWIGDGVEELIRRALAHAVPGTAPETFRERSDAETTAAETFRRTYAAFSACYAENLYERSRLYPR